VQGNLFVVQSHVRFGVGIGGDPHLCQGFGFQVSGIGFRVFG
jgi:hypothetical protein